ncbi:DUF4225 domain-containing protein [Pseudomonas entomophila]|uniref:DUF4225 domain-containing protein n=1 Tax=Pseudomonas entomophila TaxID=312306 RepID=UPI003D2FFBD4
MLPTRSGYHEMAKALGGKASHGSVAHGVMEIALSVFGLTTLVVNRSAWRLYRYVRADRVPAYKKMGTIFVTFEPGVNVMNGELIWVELTKE